MTTLLLDSDIRDWVVLPLFVIMVAAGMLRHYVSVLLRNDPVQLPKIQQRTMSVVRHASKLKTGSSCYITNYKFHIRRNHYVKLLQQEAEWCVKAEAQEKERQQRQLEEEKRRQEELELLQEQQQGDGMTQAETTAAATATSPTSTAAAANDPMANMMNPMAMMKGNMVFMVQNMVMMQGISHFFSGFILLKIPFPLTVGFKPMFQRGLFDLSTLDTSYVSSVSWYFLVMFGLRGFFRLVIGDMPYEIKLQNQLQSKFGFNSNPNPAASNPDAEQQAKGLQQEAENLQYFLQVPNKSRTIDTVEKRLLQSRYPKKSKSSSSAAKSSIVNDDFLISKKKKKKSQ